MLLDPYHLRRTVRIAPVGEQRLARVERLDDDVLEGVVGGVVMKIPRPPANNFR